MKDNKELIDVLISLNGTIHDIKGNSFSDVYRSDWGEIIETIRRYDAFGKEDHDGKAG